MKVQRIVADIDTADLATGERGVLVNDVELQ